MLEKSGFNLPNKFARILIDAMRQVMHEDDFNALMSAAELPQLARHTLPDNLEKSFDFTYLSRIRAAHTQVFGAEEGDECARLAGQTAFKEGLRHFGDLAGASDLAQRPIPMQEKLALGLPAMGRVITEFSDQLTRVYPYDEETYIYTLERCPMCWGLRSERPICHINQGLVEEGLSWASGGRAWRVEMTACVAQGDDMGRLTVYRTPLDD
ncbi:MAG: hypothetical protein ACLFTK_01995 [Anaerolineales bacterium]